jgi:hypothetical protein
MLLLTTLCGVFFLGVSLGIRGHIWAASISTAVVALAVTFLFYALFFGAAWLVSRAALAAGGRRQAESPFAEHSPPPQIVPKEVE